ERAIVEIRFCHFVFLQKDNCQLLFRVRECGWPFIPSDRQTDLKILILELVNSQTGPSSLGGRLYTRLAAHEPAAKLVAALELLAAHRATDNSPHSAAIAC